MNAKRSKKAINKCQTHPNLQSSEAANSSLAQTLMAQHALRRTSVLYEWSSLIKCGRPPAVLNCMKIESVIS